MRIDNIVYKLKEMGFEQFSSGNFYKETNDYIANISINDEHLKIGLASKIDNIKYGDPKYFDVEVKVPFKNGALEKAISNAVLRAYINTHTFDKFEKIDFRELNKNGKYFKI